MSCTQSSSPKHYQCATPPPYQHTTAVFYVFFCLLSKSLSLILQIWTDRRIAYGIFMQWFLPASLYIPQLFPAFQSRFDNGTFYPKFTDVRIRRIASLLDICLEGAIAIYRIFLKLRPPLNFHFIPFFYSTFLLMSIYTLYMTKTCPF